MTSQFISNPGRMFQPKLDSFKNPRPEPVTPLIGKQISEKNLRDFQYEREQKIKEQQLALLAQQNRIPAQKSEQPSVRSKISTPYGNPQSLLVGHQQDQVWNKPTTAQFYDEPLSNVPFEDWEGNYNPNGSPNDLVSFNETPKNENLEPIQKETLPNKKPELPKVGEFCVVYNGNILLTTKNQEEVELFVNHILESYKVLIDEIIIMKRLSIKYGIC